MCVTMLFWEGSSHDVLLKKYKPQKLHLGKQTIIKIQFLGKFDQVRFILPEKNQNCSLKSNTVSKWCVVLQLAAVIVLKKVSNCTPFPLNKTERNCGSLMWKEINGHLQSIPLYVRYAILSLLGTRFESKILIWKVYLFIF